MGGRIDIEPTTSLSFSANFGSFDSLNVRMRCGASWWASRIRCIERRLTPAAFASIRPVQWLVSPGGGPSARSTTLCTVLVGSGGLPGLRVLSRVSPSTPSAMNRACHLHTTGLDSPERAHDLGGATTVGSGKNDVGPPHMLLRRAAIRDDRLKSMAVRPGDLYDNSCSHAESLELGSAASIEMAVGMAESVS